MDTSKRLEPTLSMADRVYAVLHESIMSGEFPVGYRLRIRDLAALVGTSEMPVREAIRRLEEAGFAERVPHRGSVVKGLDLAELVHAYDVRLLLEVEATRLGVDRIGDEGIAEMREGLIEMRRAIAEGRVMDYLDLDEAVLGVLYEASGNPVLVDTLRSLWAQCRAYKTVGARSALDKPDNDALWRHQERLVDTVESGDAEAAAAVTRESLVSATDRIKAQLRDQKKKEQGKE
ncbi:GntR family transcriptional regulator [Streptomyces sp. NBC_01012]|uniref:GntR family transcriptional regulator n=1 Tax=Streptomyces sp. NBC_01012 TaxID=2903717 RepID=UPI00386D2B4C|nr:GntR family transcriptional regulator [Streptomyces sp. NBC_01012]